MGRFKLKLDTTPHTRESSFWDGVVIPRKFPVAGIEATHGCVPALPDAAVERICRALIKFHERGGRGLSLSNGAFLGLEISRLLDICRSR